MTAALAAVAFPAIAPATDRHWNVPDGQWAQGLDWNPFNVPGLTDNAILDYFSGGSAGITRLNVSTISAVTSVSVLNGSTFTIQNFGSLFCGQDMIVGQTSTQGTLNLINGNPIQAFIAGFTTAGSLRLGVNSGAGVVNQNAGTVVVGNVLTVGDSSDPSSGFRGAGTYNMSGGTLIVGTIQVGNANFAGSLSSSTTAAGTFNLSGSAVINVSSVEIGKSATGHDYGIGVFNQSGGNFQAYHVLIGDDFFQTPNNTFNLSGGTYECIQNGSTTLNRGSVFNYTGGWFAPGDLTIDGAQMIVSPGGNKIIRAGSVQVADTPTLLGVLDLNDNKITINFRDDFDLRQMIQRGFNGGMWNGSGITSSTAAATRLSALPRALGYGYDRGTPDAVVYTVYGDADLDGDADGVDIGTWALNFTGELGGNISTATKYWEDGDWDYDGDVDGVDAGLWARDFTGELGGGGLGALLLDLPNVNPGAAAILRGMGITVVPEPAAAFLAIGGMSILFRLRTRPRRVCSTLCHPERTREGSRESDGAGSSRSLASTLGMTKCLVATSRCARRSN
ncbi:MAG TPA: hypothetical protein VH518_25265 [Tepidisphaeraceae bacterium]